MQTKKHSLIESITNVAIGYGVAVASQLLIFPMFSINVSISDNLIIGLWFTAVSIARSYIVRRFFTARVGVRIKKIA